MPGVSRRPRGQIPLPGDRGHDPPPPPPAALRGLARAFTRHERRTDSSEKSNNPPLRRPEPAATPVLGAGGAQGGSPCLPPPALGSRIRRYLFLDQPPAPTGSRLGSPASADSASPCPRARCCCVWGLQPPGSCRTDSGVTAGGTSRSRSPEPCHPTPHGRGQCRSHGTPCRAQLAGHSPARRPPASSSSSSPRPPPRPAASPALP